MIYFVLNKGSAFSQQGLLYQGRCLFLPISKLNASRIINLQGQCIRGSIWSWILDRDYKLELEEKWQAGPLSLDKACQRKQPQEEKRGIMYLETHARRLTT